MDPIRTSKLLNKINFLLETKPFWEGQASMHASTSRLKSLQNTHEVYTQFLKDFHEYLSEGRGSGLHDDWAQFIEDDLDALEFNCKILFSATKDRSKDPSLMDEIQTEVLSLIEDRRRAFRIPLKNVHETQAKPEQGPLIRSESGLSMISTLSRELDSLVFSEVNDELDETEEEEPSKNRPKSP